MLCCASAFQITSFASEVHEDASHEPAGHREKMTAVLPANAANIDELQICLIDQSRCLKRVAFALLAHVCVRETVEFLINQGRQALHGFGVAGTPGEKQFGYVWISIFGHEASTIAKSRDFANRENPELT